MATWATHPDHTRYEVSDQGGVRIAATGYEIAQRSRGTRGAGRKVQEGSDHLRVDLAQDGLRWTRSVSWLVLETFVGPAPANHYARHANRDVFDARLENLSWAPLGVSHSKEGRA